MQFLVHTIFLLYYKYIKFVFLRAWRKSFPERFEVSAHGESRFPKGLAFPRMAKVISRKVWHFRAWRKSFPEWFGVSAHGESRFPNGLAFPRVAKVISRIVLRLRASCKIVGQVGGDNVVKCRMMGRQLIQINHSRVALFYSK